MEHIKSLIKEKKYILLIIAALVLAEIFFFSKYGYHWLKAVRYMILTVFMVFLGFIDQQKTIIPNKLLLFMFVIRAVILAGEITVKPSYWLDILNLSSGQDLFQKKCRNGRCEAGSRAGMVSWRLSDMV